MEYFAVIDTETNWDNEVMSIGVAIAEKETFLPVVAYYFIFDPEFRVGGMYSDNKDILHYYIWLFGFLLLIILL